MNGDFREVIGASIISADNEQHVFINANLLMSKILSMYTWIDGTVLVVSRDEVIDIIDEMRNKSTV